MSKRAKRRQDSPPPAAQIRLPHLLALGGLGVGLALVIAVLLAQRSQANGVPARFTPAYTGGPRVAVAQEVFDYGDVRFNTPVETVFRVRNVGDAPLEILGEPQVRLVEGC